MREPLDILFVHDDPQAVAEAVAALGRVELSVRHTTVRSIDELATAARRRRWDVVVLARRPFGTPTRDALATLREAVPDAPIVLVSDELPPERGAELARQGVHDWVDRDRLGSLVLTVAREALAVERSARGGALDYRTLLDASPDLVVVLDRTLAVRFASGAAELLLGRTPAELQGRDARAFVHADRRDVVLARLEAVFEGRESTLVYETELEHADGRTVAVEGVAVPLRSEGEPDSCLLVLRDLTDRRRREQRERAFFARLQQVERMEAVGRLAAGVVHDLNNALTVVLAHAELIEGSPSAPAECREDAGGIRRAVENAAELVRRVQALSPNRPVETERIDLAAAVVDIGRMLSRAVGDGVEVVVDVRDGAGAARLDPVEFERALINLAVNAGEAMEHRGRLTIAVEPLAQDADTRRRHPTLAAGPAVALRVSDTGPGMAPAVAVHVFEPFFTTRGEDGGTGLGLAQVYAFATQAGGSVYLDTEPGAGASFEIALPVETAPGPAVAMAPAPDGTTHAGDGERVLLVEDDSGLRDGLARLLARRGYRVVTASGPGDALLALAEGPIDALVTDMTMPRMDGLELAAKAREATPTLPVLVVQGLACDPARLAAIGGPPIGRVAKPFSPEQLLAALRGVLDGSSAGDTGADG